VPPRISSERWIKISSGIEFTSLAYYQRLLSGNIKETMCVLQTLLGREKGRRS
jgi:hypothetical protein